jgi:hypothetical protein
MKKYLLFAMLTAIIFSGCKKGIDPANGERPEDRISSALNTYSSVLTDNTNGWKAYLYPKGGGTYLFSINFGTNNRVSMLSDINGSTSSTGFESTYRLKAQQSPSLLFDTYSYIHLLSDPDPAVNGGDAGQGYKSDFEFYFEKVVGDTVKLIGNRLGSKLVLVKATSKADYDSFSKNSYDVVNKLAQIRTYFKRATVGGNDCEIKLNPATREITFNYLVAGNFKSVTGSFYVIGTSMLFAQPVTIGTTTFSEISNISLDATSRLFNGTINGSAFQLRESTTPLKYDLTAAATFYNNPPNGSYWTTGAGFTIDGIADAYGVKTIPSFGFLLFYPKYQPGYSRLGFIVNNAYAAYGPAPIAAFPANGTLKFTSAGAFGTPPASIAAIVTNTTNKLYDANGFYVIRTGETSYDWVSATDARSWMSWEE